MPKMVARFVGTDGRADNQTCLQLTTDNEAGMPGNGQSRQWYHRVTAGSMRCARAMAMSQSPGANDAAERSTQLPQPTDPPLETQDYNACLFSLGPECARWDLQSGPIMTRWRPTISREPRI